MCFSLLLDVSSVVHQCQLLTGALVHFISQLQYYIMFEVSRAHQLAVNYASEAFIDVSLYVERDTCPLYM